MKCLMLSFFSLFLFLNTSAYANKKTYPKAKKQQRKQTKQATPKEAKKQQTKTNQATATNTAKTTIKPYDREESALERGELRNLGNREHTEDRKPLQTTSCRLSFGRLRNCRKAPIRSGKIVLFDSGKRKYYQCRVAFRRIRSCNRLWTGTIVRTRYGVSRRCRVYRGRVTRCGGRYSGKTRKIYLR